MGRIRLEGMEVRETDENEESGSNPIMSEEMQSGDDMSGRHIETYLNEVSLNQVYLDQPE